MKTELELVYKVQEQVNRGLVCLVYGRLVGMTWSWRLHIDKASLELQFLSQRYTGIMSIEL